MARTSTTRIFMWSLVLVATAGAALSIDRVLRERPVKPQVVKVSAATSRPPAQGQSPSATVQTVAKNVAPPARPADAAEEVRPAFDIARVEPSGDAVIAGRAVPGASVELLRNGKVHDRVVADASGQF